MAQAQEPVYTVIAQGRAYQLTRSQIEFDSPNYFTMCFLGDFKEAQTRRLDISQDPVVFSFIVDYLSGYQILPRGHVNSLSTTTDMTLNKLRTDAAFFQLDGLVHLMDSLLIPYVEIMKPTEKYLAFLGTYRPIDRNLETTAEVFNNVHRWSATALTTKKRARAPFDELESPHSGSDFDDYYTVAAIQDILLLKLGKGYLQHWRLIGYKSEYDKKTHRCLNIILVERLVMASK
ncbi:unnamed protein product [Rhizoctonia solani]|uniref:BTB domain-containing protein n=1 Tax=Rhizoctonia solani TaxID=456999 RepID=A0A8H3D961_9AGAM|nr:unnamed protein product [Rhizoctonia solani]